MKKLILFFFLLIFCRGFSQYGSRMPDTTFYWTESTGMNPHNPVGCLPNGCYNETDQTNVYHQIGDTIIGSYAYRKIFYRKKFECLAFGPGPWPPFCTGSITPGYVPDSYFGALRFDTMNKKIFYVQSGTSNDTLLFDFNLSVGMVYPPCYTRLDATLKVVGEDSMSTPFGYRKRWALAHGNSPYADSAFAYVYEGIGSKYGMFNVIEEPFEIGFFLRCANQQSVNLFEDWSAPPADCNFSMSVVQIPKPDFYLIFNDLYNSIEIGIKNGGQAGRIFKLYDVGGNLVYCSSFPFAGGNKIQITLPEMASGMYFAEVTIDGQPVHKKFIANRNN